MTAQDIVEQVEIRVRSLRSKRYEDWAVGVTGDASRRRAEHGHPWFWQQWEADTEAEARMVEARCRDKGMRAAAGDQREAGGYVYIF